MILGIEFPPISHLIEWPTLFGDGAFAVNKVVLLFWLAALLVMAFFVVASRDRRLVPSGVRGVAESTIDFVREGIVMQTIGPDGLRFAPFLVTLFTFILALNLVGLLPLIQMPANARMALPALLAVLVWLVYHVVGIAKQGLFGYLKTALFIPGVPWLMYFLIVPIELVTILITRPLSLAVRLFANMLAGHLILVSFAVITAAVFNASATIVIFPFSFGLLVALTGFELLVAFLQAYIFTILAAVYIGSAMHPEH